jgi:hypothetical protein
VAAGKIQIDAFVDEARRAGDRLSLGPVVSIAQLHVGEIGLRLEAALVVAERPVIGVAAHQRAPAEQATVDDRVVEPGDRLGRHLVHDPEALGRGHRPGLHVRSKVEQRARAVALQFDAAIERNRVVGLLQSQSGDFHAPARLQRVRVDLAFGRGRHRSAQHAGRDDAQAARIQPHRCRLRIHLEGAGEAFDARRRARGEPGHTLDATIDAEGLPVAPVQIQRDQARARCCAVEPAA